MKRVFSLVVVLSLLLVALPAAAQTSLTYGSGIQIQNQSADEATVTITFYEQTGSVAAEFTGITIDGNGSQTYGSLDPTANPGGVGVDSGFSGSAVIQSDQPVVAIVNTVANSYSYGASSGSFSEGAAEVLLPLIMRGNYDYNTWFNIQNTSATEDAVVVVEYVAGSAGTDLTLAAITIPPGAAATLDQSAADHAGLGDTFVGSAKLTSTGGEIVATAIEVGPTTLFAYNGFTGGSTNPVMPLAQFNNYGYVTGMQIMNIGDTDTEVTVTYTPSSAGDAVDEAYTIAAGASVTFNRPEGGVAYGTSTFVGSATVTGNSASQPLVVVANQLNSGENKGAAYGGFDPAGASEVVALPLIMDRNYGYFTGFSIANAGSAATTVTYSCTGTDGAAYAAVLNADTAYTNIAAGAAAAPVQYNLIADSYVGACTVTAESGGEIIGIVNELSVSSTGDAFLVYEGFNQ